MAVLSEPQQPVAGAHPDPGQGVGQLVYAPVEGGEVETVVPAHRRQRAGPVPGVVAQHVGHRHLVHDVKAGTGRARRTGGAGDGLSRHSSTTRPAL